MKCWRSLDNAAKIFPAGKNGYDTNVFRIYCELNDEVDGECLDKALIKTVEDFPVFKSVMKKGFFWYYLEESNIVPHVVPEDKSPCSSIYDNDKKGLLFRVSFFNRRINLEVYHALADGTGAKEFLKVLVSNYILLKYGVTSKNAILDASDFQKADDSYKKFYEKNKKKNNKRVTAYKLNGTKMPDRRIKVTEGVCSCKAILTKAHEYKTTVTSLFSGVLLKAIYDNMAFSDRNKPVVVSIPVDLRKFFDSASTRNFFGVIFVSYDFSKNSCDLKEIIDFVDKSLKNERSKSKVKLRMNSLISVEKNVFIRGIPLIFKNIVLGAVFRNSEKYETTTVSNIGKIEFSNEFSKYLHSFGMFTATNKLQVGICSYDDACTVSFSSCFVNSEVEKSFFRMLSNMGIEFCVNSNYFGE